MKVQECKHGGCKKDSTRRVGYCEYHYRHSKNAEKVGFCKADDCDLQVRYVGYCNAHYLRWKKYGDANFYVRKASKVGDTRKNNFGYVLQYQPDYPFTQEGKGWVLQHRYVMSEHLGRPLEEHENVHHKNGVRDDNRIENLELWVVRQPYGQRVEDLLEYADWIISTYRR